MFTRISPIHTSIDDSESLFIGGVYIYKAVNGNSNNNNKTHQIVYKWSFYKSHTRQALDSNGADYVQFHSIAVFEAEIYH